MVDHTGREYLPEVRCIRRAHLSASSSTWLIPKTPRLDVHLPICMHMDSAEVFPSPLGVVGNRLLLIHIYHGSQLLFVCLYYCYFYHYYITIRVTTVIIIFYKFREPSELGILFLYIFDLF